MEPSARSVTVVQKHAIWPQFAMAAAARTNFIRGISPDLT